MLPVVAQEEEAQSLVSRQSSLEDSQDLITGQEQITNDRGQITNDSILQLSEIEQPATTIADWIAQIEASLVQITEVRVETTETGLQVILETADGSLEVPETRSIGNALIADIPNATIAEEFSQANPIEGIALVSVTSLPDNRVRVAITGTDAPPTAEVRTESQGLTFAVMLGDADAVAEEDAIQVVVTGEQEERYNPSDASTATRTDTPLRDIPQSITVVPRQVFEDRNVRTINEAVQTVPGVVDGGTIYGSPAGPTNIRGFTLGFTVGGTENLRDGVSDADYVDIAPIGTVERMEVLRGPASILYGNVQPGGVINRITRQPLSEPYYQVALEVGNYGYVQPSVDLSGPLTADDTLLYRLIAGYERSEYIQPFVEDELVTIAPSLTVNLGSQTTLNLYYEYARFLADKPLTDTVILSDGSLAPRDLYLSYPNISLYDITNHRFGYALTHEFSDNLQLRHNLAISLANFIDDRAYPVGLEDDRFVQLEGTTGDSTRDRYFGRIDLLAEFETGSIDHQLLIGFDATRFVNDYAYRITPDPPVFDLLNPDYDFTPELVPGERTIARINNYAVYLQDQIAFSDNWKLLVGGRYDWLSNDTEITDFGIFGNTVDEPIQNDGAFSPRIGIIYQPSDTISLYASYSRSFNQTIGLSRDGSAFEPSRGTQYEIGVKADLLDRLSAALAGYQITRTNVTTTDLDNPNFQVQTGEQRHRGIELEISGEILSGWNLIASYAYTNAEVTEDNVIEVGNQVSGVPEHQASLWTTYEIQGGSFEGLGFGLGLFYVGERPGDSENTQVIDGYLRTDAALYYRRDRLRAAINVSNLFDNDYVVAGGGFFALRSEPFTITGSVSWEF
ncbi:MAG: TonB-dependent siderophore receptor [Elainella sp. C42_A2020_010]|nr:TonB-dependent siderophore receptor [Elainella sp. C42_A2020_010]